MTVAVGSLTGAVMLLVCPFAGAGRSRLVVLGLPSLGNDWRDVARDDASAAITFSRLNLG